MPHAEATALLRALLARPGLRAATEAGSRNAQVGPEMTLAFLAKARKTRREARDSATNDLALIEEDLAALKAAAPGAGVALGEELAAEIAGELDLSDEGRRRTGVVASMEKMDRVWEDTNGIGDGVLGEGSTDVSRVEKSNAGMLLRPDGDGADGGGAAEGEAEKELGEGRARFDDLPVRRPSLRGRAAAAAAAAFASAAAAIPGAASRNGSTPTPPEALPVTPVSKAKASLADIHSRTALIDRFHEDVQAMYFDKRARMGTAGLQSFTKTLVCATSLSAARRLATVRHVDILNSCSNTILSAVEFNAPGTIFAAAGSPKRIKLFQLNTVLARSASSSSDNDLHCPVLEIASPAKLATVSWSRNKPGVLATGALNGAISIHDTEANTQLHYIDAAHSARVWSVDYSTQQPNLLISGSDDNSVRLWDVERTAQPSLTIAAKANVCSVKFNPFVPHELAYGSADHVVYSIDLRYPRLPLCGYEGHFRAVSNVHFLNRSDLISSSTDSSCKLWNVQEQEPGLSYGGHLNNSRFVGLCGNSDFFATGSEDCSVYVYHKGLTGPVVRYGLESPGSFVSAVCWKTNSDMLVAANNTGALEIFEMS